MSQLLQGLAVDGVLSVKVGTAAPSLVKNGIPFESTGEVAVDDFSPIDHHHQGLPFTLLGRLAVSAGEVASFGNGGAPIHASGALVTNPSIGNTVFAGVPY